MMKKAMWVGAQAVWLGFVLGLAIILTDLVSGAITPRHPGEPDPLHPWIMALLGYALLPLALIVFALVGWSYIVGRYIPYEPGRKEVQEWATRQLKPVGRLMTKAFELGDARRTAASTPHG
jgi:hypothetical protein